MLSKEIEYDLAVERYLESEKCDRMEEKAVDEMKGLYFDVRSDAFRAGWAARGIYEGIDAPDPETPAKF